MSYKTYRTEKFEGGIELDASAIEQLETHGVNIIGLQRAIAEEGRLSCDRQSDDDEIECDLHAEYEESGQNNENERPKGIASFACYRVLRANDRRYPACADPKNADHCRKELTKAILPYLELPEAQD